MHNLRAVIEADSIHHKRAASLARRHELDAREPALINLPFPLPEIPILSPILDPILSPLIAGIPAPTRPIPTKPATATQPATTPVATTKPTVAVPTTAIPKPTSTAPASAPATTSAGSSPGNTGNGASGNPSGGSTTGGGNTDSGSGSNGDGNSGSGSGSNDNNGGNTPSGSAPSSDGASSGGNPSSGSSNPPTIVGNVISNSNTHQTLSSGQVAQAQGKPMNADGTYTIANANGTTSNIYFTNANGTVVDASGNLISGISGTSTGSAPLGSGTAIAQNLGAVSAGDNISSGSESNPTLANGSAVPGSTSHASSGGGSSHGGNSGGGDGTNGGGENGSDGLASSKGNHSRATIAIVASLLGVFILVGCTFLMRRRYIAKRKSRRKRWMDGVVGYTVGEKSQGSSGEVAGPRSARSSFATNFDQGVDFNRPSYDVQTPMPAVPPTAQVRRRSADEEMTDSSTVFVSLESNTPTASNRYSGSSARSRSSGDQHMGFLDGRPLSPPASAMSCRPFTPSEMFSFPKPPASEKLPESQWASGVESWLDADRESPMSAAQASALARTSVSTSLYHTAVSSLHSHSTTTTTMTTTTTTTDASTPRDNPFADNVPVATSRPAAFAERETVRRAFAPTLHDEMAVSLGEVVRVHHVFDDGWAHVEKLQGALSRQQGLIPLDCLRDAAQDLPSFLAARRVSSYTGIELL